MSCLSHIFCKIDRYVYYIVFLVISGHMPRILPPFSTARVHVLDEDVSSSTQGFGLMVFSSFISFVELLVELPVSCL